MQPRLGPSRTNSLLRLVEDTSGKVALGKLGIFQRPFLSCIGLCESCASTKGTSQGTVLYLDDADILGAADCTVARHSLRHLDFDGEVGGSGTR